MMLNNWMDPNMHLYISYSGNQYDNQNDIYYPLSQVLLNEVQNNPRTSDSLIFDMNRLTIYAKGKEFGGLTPVFPKVNTGVINASAINVWKTPAYFVSSVSQDKYGKISYTYNYAYFSANFNNTTAGVSQGNKIITNDSTYKLITGISQASNGQISYTYIKLNTNFTYAGDNVLGPVFQINVDKNGKIGYIHKNLSVNSGISSGNEIITNNSSYKLINNIVQNADGTISYTYITLNTAFRSGTAIQDTGVSNLGLLTHVSIDSTGNITEYYKNLSSLSSAANYQSFTYTKGIHISNGISPSTYTLVLTGMMQDKYGKISYSYTALYTDPRNYKYHDFSINNTASTNTNPTADTINAITTITTSNTGSNESHQLTYSLASVPTKHYVDTKISNVVLTTDALRYSGTIKPALISGAPVEVTIVSDINDSLASSRGAVYKVNGSGYFGTSYVTSGDMIISASDSNSIVKNASTYLINSNYSNWDVINNNLNLITEHIDDVKSGAKIVTGVNLFDDGRLSYTTYSLGVQNEQSFSNNLDSAAVNETNKSKDISLNVSPNTSSAKGFRVITDVKLEQNNLDTKLKYTYSYIYVGKYHHSTLNTAIGGVGKVISSVNLSTAGVLSYTYTNIATSDYHYQVTTTAGTYVNFNKDSGTYTFSATRENGHLTGYTYTFVTDKHLGLQTANSSSTSAYWFSGFATGADPGANNANYNAKLGSVHSKFPSFKFNDGNNEDVFNINSNLYLESHKIIMQNTSNVVVTLPGSNHKMYFENLKSLWGEIVI